MHALRTTLLLACAQLVVPSNVALQSLPSAVRWTVPISASPMAAPVIDGDQIFVVLQSGVVAAHRVSDGKQSWEVPLRSDYPVAVEPDQVYVVANDGIHALKAADGTRLWFAQTGKVTAPLLAHQGWVIAASANRLTAFRSADGSTVWSRETGEERVRPTIEGDNLYVPLEDGRLLALDLRTGADRWVRGLKGPLSEVLALPDRVYVGSGDKNFYSLRAGDGAWDWKQRLGALVRGRPVADDRRIYVTAMDNTVHGYRRSNGEHLWHPSVPFRPTTGPALIGSVVLVSGNAAELRAFDAATGKPLGQITLPEPLPMPPAFGRSKNADVMAAFTGNLNGEWKLVLAGPPAPAPAIPHE